MTVSKKQRRRGWEASNRRTCTSHKRFVTYEAAMAHYRDQLRANTTDPGQTVFRCLRCRGWHHGGGIRSLGRLLAQQPVTATTPPAAGHADAGEG